MARVLISLGGLARSRAEGSDEDMKRLLVFHQALAPYRIDFFNALAGFFDVELMLFDTNLLNQKFNQAHLVKRLRCRVSYLLRGVTWRGRRYRIGAIRKVRKTNPDIVLGCEYSLVTISLALYRFFFRRRFKLYTLSDDNLEMFRARSGLKAFLRWIFIRLLDGIILTNEETKIAYESITPKGARIRYHVVPILHEEAEIRAEAKTAVLAGVKWRQKSTHQFSKVVLFVGRLVVEKGVDWLLTQLGRLGGSTEIVLVIVGSGPLEERLKKTAAQLRMANIFFAGRREGRGVYEMMSMADCLVLPSWYEPYGAVVGEALQLGTPCLVSDRVGAKDLITERNGAVFRTGDVQDFSIKLKRVLALGRSSGSLVSNRLRASVQEWAWEAEGK